LFGEIFNTGKAFEKSKPKLKLAKKPAKKSESRYLNIDTQYLKRNT